MTTVTVRLQNNERISQVALNLGEEKTREQLIPSLTEYTKVNRRVKLTPVLSPTNGYYNKTHNEGDVLLERAIDLGAFIPYIGGVEYAHLLLQPLEALCILTAQPFVRDQAVDSLCLIGAQMKESDIVHWFIPLIKRLASGMSFPDRVSSCGIFHIAYPNAPENLKTELRLLYSHLSRDDMPVVRRSVASNLGKFAATVEPSHLKTSLVLIFRYLAQDDEDSVRLYTVKVCTTLLKLLEPQDCVAHVLPVIINFSQDKFWRVRYTVANQLYEFSEAVGPGSIRVDLVHAYMCLLRDDKAEVRAAAAGNVTKFCGTVSPKLVTDSILPHVKELSSDSSLDVLNALSSVISGLSSILGKDATIEHLVPIVMLLLKDEDPAVKFNIIGKLDQLTEILKDSAPQSLVNAAGELAKDSDWMIRLAALMHLTVFSAQIGKRLFRCVKDFPQELLEDQELEINLNCGTQASPEESSLDGVDV